jgi:hypothetical protein
MEREEERKPVISAYIDVHMKICELNSYIRDWLYQQGMVHKDNPTEAAFAKLTEVRRRLAAVYAYMEGRSDGVLDSGPA